MKLLNKISYYHFLNTAALFLLGLFAIYFSVDWIITERTDGQLSDSSKEVRYKLSQGIRTEYSPLVEIKILQKETDVKPAFKDTVIYLKSENEYEAYRQYTVYKNINGINYRIIVRASLIEKEDLFSAILIILVVVLALLLIILLLINRYTAKKIFQPFYKSLKKLETFSLQKNKILDLEDSQINEFNEMNRALKELSAKAINEYQSLKEFSEDLNHELQTPVAVIKAKTEILMQKEFVDHETNENIQSILNNADRLDKLNRSLILLSKLETSELFSTTSFVLREKVDKILNTYLDIYQSKEILLERSYNSEDTVSFNENLFEIMIGNLISNSIKHNISGGKVFVELQDSTLTIKNEGKEPKQNPENYFKRFTYDEKSPNSLGLGLAIVKKICDMNKISIKYEYEKPFHILTVKFNHSA